MLTSSMLEGALADGWFGAGLPARGSARDWPNSPS